MPLDDEDLSLIIDMIECIDDIAEFTKDVCFEDFEKDKMRRLAVERQLEVIGQAAGKVSKGAQDHYPSVPWPRIIGLRNRLAHDYGEILSKRIWDISRNSVPVLREQLASIEEVSSFIHTRTQP